jgi:hypothetical protein
LLNVLPKDTNTPITNLTTFSSDPIIKEGIFVSIIKRIKR